MIRSQHFYFVLFLLGGFGAASAGTAVFDVRNYGAKVDGISDATNAFLAAWRAACSLSSGASASVSIPMGNYLLSPVSFNGPCKKPISVQVAGTIVAPTNTGAFKCGQNWIEFKDVDGLTLEGNGVFDGRGSSWWSKYGRGCQGPTSLGFVGTSNTVVSGITSVNSKQFHIVFDCCKHVRAQQLTIKAPADSPNTDGIHVGQSSDVKILDINVGTGDDCISIGPGTYDVFIQTVNCGPGHGISVGSLGNEAVVQNVTVNDVTFQGTENGVRIKTWKGGNGLASQLVFENVKMKNVKNPIIINQNYCPDHSGCTVGHSSGVKIRDVVYKNITGSSATKAAVHFSCSQSSPCQGIKVADVNLSFENGGQAQSVCQNAQGSAIGVVRPPSCLS